MFFVLVAVGAECVFVADVVSYRKPSLITTSMLILHGIPIAGVDL